MSKKQSIRKKISVRLYPEETAIVIGFDTAMHIAETYDYLASEHVDEYSDSFRQIADIIRQQANENYYAGQEEYEEW